MTKQEDKDRRILIALLDELCAHEESVIECATIDGQHGPGRTASDAMGYNAARRSRRVWRRAQDLMIRLESSENPVLHSSWVWNRRIIEAIRAVVPNPPVLDEDLVDRVRKIFETARGVAAQ